MSLPSFYSLYKSNDKTKDIVEEILKERGWTMDSFIKEYQEPVWKRNNESLNS